MRGSHFAPLVPLCSPLHGTCRAVLLLTFRVGACALQCVSEGWKDKIKEQATEGCNLAGKVRVNKVIGNLCAQLFLSDRQSLDR